MLNFINLISYNKNCEIRTHDYLIIKALIPYQRSISAHKLKLLGSRCDLYYSNMFFYPFAIVVHFGPLFFLFLHFHVIFEWFKT